MSGLNDPYVVGQLIGSIAGAGAVGYFVARKAFPAGRTKQVAKLMEAAGVTDEEAAAKPGFRPPPWLIALGAGLLSGVLTLGNIAKQGFTARDLPELRTGFVHGCSKTCMKEGAPQALCDDLCGCVRTHLEADLQTEPAVVDWFNRASKQETLAMSQVGQARASCLAEFQAKAHVGE
ncbi:MAG TPA: hypothetical protein VHB79_33035 [Polyangiaceae bacterium]|nr:hypothetical protein [Polyangiaceae bacterium]